MKGGGEVRGRIAVEEDESFLLRPPRVELQVARVEGGSAVWLEVEEERRAGEAGEAARGGVSDLGCERLERAPRVPQLHQPRAHLGEPVGERGRVQSGLHAVTRAGLMSAVMIR